MLKRIDPFAVLGVVALGAALYAAAQQSATTSLSHPRTKTTVVGDEKTVAEYDAEGKLHGIEKVYLRGNLFTEAEYSHGQTIWAKAYWMNGNLRTYRFESGWSHELRTHVYDESGKLIETY